MSATPTLHLPRWHSAALRRGFRVFLQSVAALFPIIAREIRIRRDISKLAELDDRMLRDIGLTRTEIEPVVRQGRSSVGFLGLPK